MSDAYFTEEGDLVLDPAGDIGITTDPWRHHSQQAYIRLKTDLGDYPLYPQIGSEVHKLRGMPQKSSTGEYGKKVILEALRRDPVLGNYPINVEAVPTSYSSIRFDVYLTARSTSQLILSVEQELGFDDNENEQRALES